MPYGYHGRILRVDLSKGNTKVEEPPDLFYRTYLGGWGFIGYYLLTELKPGIDPLGPDNKLIIASGALSGYPIGGASRYAIGAKSPVTGSFGASEVGGFIQVELKRAGYDAIIIEGQSKKPVYLWITESGVEIRDAAHLWGKTTGEVQELIRAETDPKTRVAQIGPGGENLVLYANIMHDLTDAAGRAGMGAVMGSKKLRAIAVRGKGQAPEMADRERFKSAGKWLADNIDTLAEAFHKWGTGANMTGYNETGNLPTHNWQAGTFPGADDMSGKAIEGTIRVKMDGCYACPIRCKKVVKVGEPYNVDPIYGGPEYETTCAVGTDCGVGDMGAVSKASALCNALGIDTISTGATIAWAMECFEKGLLTTKDTGGIELRFGNAEAMLKMVEMIANREGLGDLLAEGTLRASKKVGGDSEEWAIQVKGQELPMHDPRSKHAIGLGYAVSPTGADHCHNIHDILFVTEGPSLDRFKPFGDYEPISITGLAPEKIHLTLNQILWHTMLNSACCCMFVPYYAEHMVDLIGGITGWNTSADELVMWGERGWNMARACP